LRDRHAGLDEMKRQKSRLKKVEAGSRIRASSASKEGK
jgi:hypothetical protein